MTLSSFSSSKLMQSTLTACIIIAHLSLLSPVDAFSTPYSSLIECQSLGNLKQYHNRNKIRNQSNQRWNERSHCGYGVMLQMGYNLPPDSNNKINWKDDVLIPAASAVGLALFFISPLGGIFFAVTNSLFVLALLTPFILYIGFQGWQLFYTKESPCPNCKAPVRTLKDDAAQPTVCLSCGSMVRNVSGDGDGLELCGPPPGNSFFNTDKNNGNDIFYDFFAGDSNNDNFSQQQETSSTSEVKRFKREQTIIDVEVDRDN